MLSYRKSALQKLWGEWGDENIGLDDENKVADVKESKR
jgi:hypothetical protein